MSRVRLHRPDHPRLLRLLLSGVEFLASLRLAVVLLTFLILVLAVATFIETTYGAEAARFAVYRAWWFTWLGGLLAVNVLCAALVRFPWRKHQTGFVMTHAGIIILLVGSLWSARQGIDAQLSIYEDGIGHIAFQDTLHFEIDIASGQQRTTREATAGVEGDDRGQSPRQENRVVRFAIPFRSGPFNWCDYSQRLEDLLWAPPGRLPILPWQLARRDQGVVFSHERFRLEVLDYYADSRRIRGGYLAGYVRSVTPGQDASWLAAWQPIELELQTGRRDDREGTAIGSRVTLGDGTRVVLLAAATQAELDGFLLGTPVEPLDEQGQVVLIHNRVRYVLPVSELQAHQGEMPLGRSDLRITQIETDPRLQAVQLRLKDRNGVEDDLILFADLPEFNRQARRLGVAGSYWVDFPRLLSQADRALQLHPRATAGATRLRLDLCQGPDNRLYYRLWRSPELLKLGEVPLTGQGCILLAERGCDVRLMVNSFAPWDPKNPDAETVVPLPFRKGKRMTEPRVRVRLSAGDQSRETWLAVIPRGARDPVSPEELASIEAGSEQMRVTVQYDAVEVGFRLKLREFQRKLDPGTNQPSFYASLVDLYVPERLVKTSITEGPDVPPDAQETVIDPRYGERLRLVHPKILITLNHPANIVDPVTGRSYRLYQESFSGPFRPGDPVYEQVVAGKQGRPVLYASTLSVNYDPGRGLKYTGSLLIVGGVVVIYLMRAYIFRPRARKPEHATGQSNPELASISKGKEGL